MSPELDVLCVADMCIDLVIRGNVRPRFQQVEQLVDDYEIELGGSANIMASQFVKLGGHAGVIGAVGRDAFGGFILSSLEKLGVDISRVRRVPNIKTGLGVALVERDDRAILTYIGSIDVIRPSDLGDRLLTTCRHWHIVSFFLLCRLRHYWPTWLQRCREAGITTSLDTNWDPDERWEGVLELIPMVDVFLPNELEAMTISGEEDIGAAGMALAAKGPTVVIKRGDRGASAFRGKERWDAPAVDYKTEDEVVDSIGAGDNFDAGFLRAWLLNKHIIDCLELANRCASASLEAAGGTRGQLVMNVE